MWAAGESRDNQKEIRSHEAAVWSAESGLSHQVRSSLLLWRRARGQRLLLPCTVQPAPMGATARRAAAPKWFSCFSLGLDDNLFSPPGAAVLPLTWSHLAAGQRLWILPPPAGVQSPPPHITREPTWQIRGTWGNGRSESSAGPIPRSDRPPSLQRGPRRWAAYRAWCFTTDQSAGCHSATATEQNKS